MTQVRKAAVWVSGRNYLHCARLAAEGQNEGTRAAMADGAGYSRRNLYEYARRVEDEIAATGRSLALRAESISPAGWGDPEDYEYGRYLDLERELARLERIRDDIEAFLAGHEPEPVAIEDDGRAELLALATRARVSAAGRRMIGAKARGSYDAEVVQRLVADKVAKEPRHAINLLNLSRGLAEGWSNDELVYWAIVYRRARGRKESKETAVEVANKALAIG